MKTVLLLFAGLPGWAIGAIFGAAFALVGAFIGEGLRRLGVVKTAKLVPIIAIAVSFPITKAVVFPAVDEARLNIGLPKRLDDSTIHEATRTISGGLEYQFLLTGDIPASFKAVAIKDMNLIALCKNWKEDFDARRATRIDYSYRWAAGSDSFSLSPGDCQ